MPEEKFIDYYDLLEISSTENAEAVEAAVRAQLRRYSPQNKTTADAEKFELVKKAYLALSNPKSRSSYDAEHKRRNGGVEPAEQQSLITDAMRAEVSKRHVILTVLYERMLKKPQDGALTGMEISSGVGMDFESLEFPIWFLREKGYISRTDVGDLRITAKGVEWLEESHGVRPTGATSPSHNPKANGSAVASIEKRSKNKQPATEAVNVNLLAASEGALSH